MSEEVPVTEVEEELPTLKEDEVEPNNREVIKDLMDDVRPKTEAREWLLVTDEGTEFEVSKTFVQKPLTFFGKMELVSILGDAIEKAITDPNRPLSVSELVSTGTSVVGGLENMQGTDEIVLGVSRLARYSPELFKEIYCISLNVPREFRLWAYQALDECIDDDDGFEILTYFIDQNAESLRSFFVDKGRTAMMSAFNKFRKPVPSSKPSKRSAQSTVKK